MIAGPLLDVEPTNGDIALGFLRGLGLAMHLVFTSKINSRAG